MPCDPSTSYRLSNVKNPFQIDYVDSVANNSSREVSWSMTSDKSTEYEYSVSVKLSTSENALIFGKIQAEINAGVAKKKSTKYGSQVSGSVAPHTEIDGARGMYVEKVGFTKTVTYSNCHTKTTKGNAGAPYKESWHLDDKRI